MAVYDEGYAPAADAPRLSNLVNYAGAVLSLALILGVSFWGYQLIVRDVSGIPVVRAMEGDMRVLPDNPGGAIAPHTGLSVNEVAAVGEAGGPEDRLVLAPRTAGLAQEDLEAQPTAEAPTLASVDATPPSDDTPILRDDVAALAEQLAALSTPTEPEPAQAEETAAVEVPAPTVDLIPASVPGVATSLRPLIRPAAFRTVAPAAPATANSDEVAVTTTTFPAGTNLVQLGAFPSPALAAQEWERLQARFGQLMTGKDRVIQVSNQSSATWYRLRASGFADRDDARRLCAALQAEGADCIAVVTN
ncbi:MAG: SPOR domain-containing protein [Pseudomonadota bacterium]